MERQDKHARPNPANLRATSILDFGSPVIQEVIEQLAPGDASGARFVRAAHDFVLNAVRPVYTVDELQSASVTFQKKKGSCSQRMACLEALCRAHGVATRVRALWVVGRFWYPRFRYVKAFIPKRILLAWPQFYFEDGWIDVDEIYHPATELVKNASAGFTNDDETLFEAIMHLPIDFLGKSRQCGLSCASTVDLSKFVLADDGFFDTRDELFATLGSFQYSFRGRAFEMVFGGRKSR